MPPPEFDPAEEGRSLAKLSVDRERKCRPIVLSPLGFLVGERESDFLPLFRDSVKLRPLDLPPRLWDPFMLASLLWLPGRVRLIPLLSAQSCRMNSILIVSARFRILYR